MRATRANFPEVLSDFRNPEPWTTAAAQRSAFRAVQRITVCTVPLLEHNVGCILVLARNRAHSLPVLAHQADLCL